MFEIVSILALIVILSIIINVLADPDEQAIADAKFCNGCDCGWCMYVPDDDECKKWREQHERRI